MLNQLEVQVKNAENAVIIKDPENLLENWKHRHCTGGGCRNLFSPEIAALLPLKPVEHDNRLEKQDRSSTTTDPPTLDEIYKVADKINAGEVGLAQLLVEKHRDKLRYDIRERDWYGLGPHSWKRVSDARPLECFEELADRFRLYALMIAQKKIEFAGKDKSVADKYKALEKIFLGALKVLGDVSRRSEILRLCRSEGSYLGFDGPWDEDPYRIATPNGVLNLGNLSFGDGSPEDNIRTATSTLWEGIDAPCFLFEKTILEIFDGNQEIVDYLQCVFGYGISGLTKYHHLWIFEGRGRNGKTLLYKILKYVLGDLVGLLDRELLLDKKHPRQSGAATPDIMSLRGKRMAFLVETSEGRKFDPGKLKVLTGGDLLHARGLYAKDYSDFPNTTKIFVLTNSRPHISGGDYASWQRILLVPFALSFVPEPSRDPNRKEKLADPDLEEKLKAEASGILAWLVRGYVRSTANFNPPNCIQEATVEYKKEEDLVGRFIEEKIERYIGNFLPAGECYSSFKVWCEAQDIHPKHNSVFSREMKGVFETIKRGNNAFYVNVKVKG